MEKLKKYTSKRKTVYSCATCDYRFDEKEKAKQCFDQGVDQIHLSKGLMLGYQDYVRHISEANKIDYLVLYNTQTFDHLTTFYWDLVHPLNLDFHSFKLGHLRSDFAPSNTERLRKMLNNKGKDDYIRPLSKLEFENFLKGANHIERGHYSNEHFDMIKERGPLIHRHPELERVLREEGIK